MINIKYSLGLFLILIFSIELNAQSLSGSWGYKIDGKQITLYGDKISNHNNGGQSVTIIFLLERKVNFG